MLQTPLLLIVFNRPDLTQLVFEEIKKAKPTRLFVSADGARLGNETDYVNCKKCLDIIELVDWDCEVQLLKQEKNLGCGRAVSTGITWFFEQVEEGIILEDDCIPNKSFFTFCEKMLNHYRNNEQVMHIGGTNFQGGIQRGDGSYYFSAIPHVWGWATWRRAWAKYNFDIKDLLNFKAQKKLDWYYSDKKIRRFWIDVFHQMETHQIDTWDHQWSYTIWNNGGLTIIPQNNLIKNLGFRSDATHTFGDSPMSAMETTELEVIRHPLLIEQNKAADTFTFYAHHPDANLSVVKRIFRKVKTYLK